MIGGKKVWLGFMLLLVSAMLIPQVAAAQGGVAPAAPQAALGQTLPDSVLQDMSGKDSSIILQGFGNGETYKYYQINQATDWSQVGDQGLNNSIKIKYNHDTLISTLENQVGSGNDPNATNGIVPNGVVRSGSLNSNTFGNVMGVVGVVKVGR